MYHSASLHHWRECLFVCLLIWIWWLRSNDSFKNWKIDVCFLDSAVCYKSMTTEVSSKREKKQTITMRKRESTNATVNDGKTREVRRQSIRLQHVDCWLPVVLQHLSCHIETKHTNAKFLVRACKLTRAGSVINLGRFTGNKRYSSLSAPTLPHPGRLLGRLIQVHGHKWIPSRNTIFSYNVLTLQFFQILHSDGFVQSKFSTVSTK